MSQVIKLLDLQVLIIEELMTETKIHIDQLGEYASQTEVLKI